MEGFMIIKVFLTVATVWVIQGVFELLAGEWWQLSLSLFSIISLFIANLTYARFLN
jgi:hypothetical protein